MLSAERTQSHNVPVWDAQGFTLGYVSPNITSVGVCKVTGAARAEFDILILHSDAPNPWGWFAHFDAQ